MNHRPEAAAEKPRVLIIDDEGGVAKAFRRVVQSAGIEVELAADGAEAERKIAELSFDAVVTDIHLPDMSGVDILRMIRSRNLDVPVVLVTGDPSLKTAIEAVELGAIRYLVKPVANDELKSTVTRAVQLHRFAQLKREVLREAGHEDKAPSDLAGLSSRLSSALDKLWIAFQPIIDLKNDCLYGYEALMRSREPSLPGPMEVIKAAERLDKVNELGVCVRGKIGDALSQLEDDQLNIFVNLHPSELLDDSLHAPGPLADFASNVVLEVTERSSLENLHDLKARTSRLRSSGYRLAVDDLGAGYAGLTSFVTLEPELVKLDMTLIRGIDKSPIRQQLVRSMVDLCTVLGMQNVAEGIETAEELATLRELGCHLAQGYFIGRPAAGFAKWGVA